VRDGGAITERPDHVDPTVELHRDASGPPVEPAQTRNDLPQRQADPTRDDLPRRPSGARTERLDADRTQRISAGPTGRPHDDKRQEQGDPARDDGPGRPYGDRPRRRRLRWVRRVVWLLLLLILATPLGAGARVWYVARQDDRTHSDAIVVLGAAQFNGRPSAVLEWRLLHALKLYREGVAPAIVTVGGNRPGDAFTEAGTGKAWLNQHGVPNRHLVAVRSGTDTLQSMVAVGAEYRQRGWHSAVIVTDPWHALRSRTMARDNGIKAVTSPTRSGPTVGSRDTQFNYIVREAGGYLYYVLVGRWRGDS
jgi:uncharacterized SAM-binding protein YcdF (DUF218 family)